jgi:DNA-binding protein HU-beta
MKQNTNKPKAMHKNDLISSLSEISGLSRNEATQALNAFLLSITKSLKDGKDVRLSRFGAFRVLLRPEREGRNPRTGKPLKVPAQKVPKFQPSLMLRDEIV